MFPSHEAGPGSLPALAPRPRPLLPAATPVGAGVSVSRVLRIAPAEVFAALTDPWTLLALHGAGTVLRLDDAPWRLSVGDTLEFDVDRWGATHRARLTVDGVVDGSGLTWTVDYSRSGRVVHTGERWTVWAERHPRGTWVDLSVENTVLPHALSGLRRRTTALRRDMTARLREFDLLLTRHDRPAVGV